MTKTGGTLDWLGCCAFGVEESDPGPAEGRGVEVMGFTDLLKSPTYILLSGLAALRWAEAPGRSGLVSSSRLQGIGLRHTS